MIIFDSPVIIFGAGSIGERHISILLELGYTNIHVYRQRNLPLRTIDESKINVFTDIDLIDTIKPATAFITSPTSFHIEEALFCASKKIHVLVEKPLSNNTDRIDELKQTAIGNNVLVQVAYMLRFHPAFIKIKSIITSGEYGRLLYMHSHWGDHLVNWHPWEDYRTSYAARKELGGGVALTLSHDIDIAAWLCGETIEKYFSLANTKSLLEVNVESGVDFLFLFPSGTTAHIHLNYFQQRPFRQYQFIFDEAQVQYNYLKNLLTIETQNEKKEESFNDFERNDMFRKQTVEFFNNINTTKDHSSITVQQLNESKRIIEMCERLY